MRPALHGSGNLDQQTGLVIFIYYICAFPGSLLNGYLEEGSTNHWFRVSRETCYSVNNHLIPNQVDKYKRFKLITCIWYASAVVGFSGGISN